MRFQKELATVWLPRLSPIAYLPSLYSIYLGEHKFDWLGETNLEPAWTIAEAFVMRKLLGIAESEFRNAIKPTSTRFRSSSVPSMTGADFVDAIISKWRSETKPLTIHDPSTHSQFLEVNYL